MPSPAPANLRCGGGPRNSMERRWWLWGLARELGRLGADLVHGPDFAVPYLLRRPSVLTLHDLSPWMDARWHHAAHRVRRRTPVLLELGLATMVITPGEKVRRQAIERFGLRPERVVAVPEAAAHWFRPVRDRSLAPPYFLFVGTLEPRKNLQTLLEAWREVRRKHAVDLVLAGRRRADAPDIATGARTAPGGRSCGFRTAGAVFGRAGVCLPFALRRLRPAGAGGDAVRRARDRLARRGRSGGRCRDLRRYARANWRARWRHWRRTPNCAAAARERSLARAARILLGTHRPADPSGLRGGACPLWSLSHTGPSALFPGSPEAPYPLAGGGASAIGLAAGLSGAPLRRGRDRLPPTGSARSRRPDSRAPGPRSVTVLDLPAQPPQLRGPRAAQCRARGAARAPAGGSLCGILGGRSPRAVGGAPLRPGRDRALLVRALPGAAVAGLRAHRARPAQYRERASRALRRGGRPRHCRCPPRLPGRLASAGARLAAALLPGAGHLAGRCRHCPRDRAAGHGRGLPERHARAAACRRPATKRPSSSPATWSITPTSRRCGSSDGKSGRGCASAGRELVWRLVGKNPAAVRRFTAGDARIEVAGPVQTPSRTRARQGGGGAIAGGKRHPAEDSGGLGGRAAGGFHHARRGRPAGTRRGDSLTGDGAAAFVDAVTRLLACSELRQKIGSAGRLLLEKEFTWETAWKKLDF